MLLVIRATPLPQVWLFVFRFPVDLVSSFGFHAPVCSYSWCLIRLVRVPLTFTHTGPVICSDFWCLVRLVRIPLAPTPRYVRTLDVFFALYAFQSRTDVFGILTSASHHNMRPTDFHVLVCDVKCLVWFALYLSNWFLPCKLEVWQWAVKRRIFDPNIRMDLLPT